ncbi:MAG: hypothetical protein CM15mV56_180 [uncultured marine virus]|nr:MAG: hypothetical protein CM15mV56_180 [uncultured marine virus]
MFLSKSKIALGKDFETEEERREDLKRTIGIQAYEVLEAPRQKARRLYRIRY